MVRVWEFYQIIHKYHPGSQRARKFKKVQAKKNSWNQINQFHEKICFWIFSMKIKILLSEIYGKYPKTKFPGIDSFHLTSFLDWTFFWHIVFLWSWFSSCIIYLHEVCNKDTKTIHRTDTLNKLLDVSFEQFDIMIHD